MLVLSLAGCASTGPAPVEDKSYGAPRPAPPPPVSRPVAPKAGIYRVERGDTLYSIAFRHGIDYRDLAAWNDIPSPYTIYPGRELRLSQREGAPRPVAQAAPPPKPAPASPPPKAPAPTPFEPVAAAPVPAEPAGPPPSAVAKTAEVKSTAPPPAPPSPPPAAQPAQEPVATNGDIAWRWPADGQVVGGYVGGDPMKQGVDIAGQSGTPVRAAADGTVVYSGNGLIGYGELIIIKHNAAFLSAYGHNRKRLVQEGERVKSGQTIAEMGSSSANRDELHFEIRKNGKPANPLDYLPRR